MRDDKRSGNAAWIVAAVLLVLPVVYVGSYLALVEPHSHLVFVRRSAVKQTPRNVSNYRYGDDVSEVVFWPLEQLDRRIRPKAWDKRLFID
jgi:hypothetical protein